MTFGNLTSQKILKTKIIGILGILHVELWLLKCTILYTLQIALAEIIYFPYQSDIDNIRMFNMLKN